MTCMFSPTSQINVTEFGQGTPVVLLHGSASSGKQWRSLTEYLQGRFHVICPDLPGYGRSALPVDTTSPDLTGIATAVMAVIDHSNVPFHIVGHSFGAAVALKIATLWPEKVRSMTLIEPAAFNALWANKGFEVQDAESFAKMAGSSHALMAKGDCHGAMRGFIDFWNGAGAWDRTSGELQDKLATCMGQVLKDFEVLVTDNVSEWELTGVVCPVQILRGDCSPEVVATISSQLIETLPFATEAVFEGAGHMLPLTDPHLVDPKIADFLEKVDSTWQSDVKITALAA